MVIDHLGAHPEGGQPGAQGQQQPARPGGGPAAQQPQQQGHGQGEEEGEDHPLHRQGVEAVHLQKKLLIINDPQQKQGGEGQPPPARPPGNRRGFVLVQGAHLHLRNLFPHTLGILYCIPGRLSTAGTLTGLCTKAKNPWDKGHILFIYTKEFS